MYVLGGGVRAIAPLSSVCACMRAFACDFAYACACAGVCMYVCMYVCTGRPEIITF